jgi:hypothetical protein
LSKAQAEASKQSSGTDTTGQTGNDKGPEGDVKDAEFKEKK